MFSPTHLITLHVAVCGQLPDQLPNQLPDQLDVFGAAEILSAQFSRPSVEGAGIFSANWTYAAVFARSGDGRFRSTLNKACLFPADAHDTRCIFVRDEATRRFLHNPGAEDVWTKRPFADPSGGTGLKIMEQIRAEGDPYSHRTILTWRPGVKGYVRADPNTLTTADTRMAPEIHGSAVNRLWGYREATKIDIDGRHAPVGVADWAQGGTINAPVVLLQYTRGCEAASDRCYAVAAANDGAIHIFDAVTGKETSALVPGELWPQIGRQTYLVDGGMRLFHDDTNGNLIIDPGERAFLYLGLGRGGAAYYRISVNPLAGGVLRTEDNPPQRLAIDPHSTFKNLRETWAAPVFTMAQIQRGRPRQKVAVLVSGHVARNDAPLAPLGSIEPDLGDALDLRRFTSKDCASMLKGGSVPVTACKLFYRPECSPRAGPPKGCYDSVFTGAQPPSFAPLSYPIRWSFSEGSRRGAAYRLHLPGFSLQPGDYLRIEDDEGHAVAEYAGTGQDLMGGPPLDSANNGAAAWVYGASVKSTFVTNGVDDAPAAGIQFGPIDVVERDIELKRRSEPTVWVIGVDRCEGCVDAFDDADAFALPPSDGHLDLGVLLRVTRRCDGVSPNEICVDENGSGNAGAASPDLSAMVCPISAEPSVYAPGGILEAIYVGDECGQIWKIGQDSASGVWSSRLLLRTNKPAVGLRSKDYRKIFTRLDLALSMCNGARSVGVYFATGNIQRPAARDNLQDPKNLTGTVSNPRSDRDVYGVVFDSRRLSWGARLDDLVDTTKTVLSRADLSSGKAQNGWYLEGGSGEGFFRDPLVFQGVAYFKSHSALDGLDRAYALDACTGGPGGASLDAREAWRKETHVGGEFLLLTPKRGDPVVTLGTTEITSFPRVRTMRIFNWWRKR